MLNDELDTTLNRLLSQWHDWSRSYRYGKGYPSADATCRQARASRQYDDTNGALDAKVDSAIMEAFDAAVNRVPQPHVTALMFQARNFSTGANVWLSPRLPVDPLERRILTMEARNILMRELARDGVLN